MIPTSSPRLGGPACAALIVLLSTVHGSGCGDTGSETQWQLLSPDGRLEVNLYLNEPGPVYNLKRDGHVVLEDSRLGISLDTGTFSRGLRFVRAERRQVDT
jgi:hypothetical protein